MAGGRQGGDVSQPVALSGRDFNSTFKDELMKKNFGTAILLAGLCATGVAQAQTALTASVGLSGVGLHVSVPIQQDLQARVGINGLNYSHSGSTGDVDYDFKLKMRTIDALIDWFPSNSEFRLSGGIVYNGNKVDAVGRSNSSNTFELNGNTYNAASVGTLDGRIDFRKVAPYLGIGWGNPLAQNKGWGFSFDLGTFFQGSARTSLTNSNCNLPAAGCAQLVNDVAAENDKLHDKASKYKFFPVVRIGATYKF
jgi:hypothetical protein